MYKVRVQQALRLALMPSGEPAEGASAASSSSRSEDVRNTDIVDVNVRPIEQIVTGYFEAQAATFPHEQLEQLLGCLAQDVSGHIAEASVPTELDVMLREWFEREHARFEIALTEILHGVAVAGFLAAFQSWKNRLGLAVRPGSGMMKGLYSWASRRTAELLALIDRTTRTHIIEIIVRGLKNGAAVSETLHEIRGYLNGLIAGRALKIARAEASNAVHQGALDANRVLGATAKQWFTCGDMRVCGSCWENELQGAIPIAEPFLSGHQRPWAHLFCRCTVVYYGVTRESFLQALGLVP